MRLVGAGACLSVPVSRRAAFHVVSSIASFSAIAWRTTFRRATARSMLMVGAYDEGDLIETSQKRRLRNRHVRGMRAEVQYAKRLRRRIARRRATPCSDTSRDLILGVKMLDACREDQFPAASGGTSCQGEEA